MTAECPHCGSPMKERFGERFPRLKAEMIDTVQHMTAAQGGVDMESLTVMFYSGVPTPTAKSRIRVHVSQINDMLAATDWRIIHRYGLYQLVETSAA